MPMPPPRGQTSGADDLSGHRSTVSAHFRCAEAWVRTHSTAGGIFIDLKLNQTKPQLEEMNIQTSNSRYLRMARKYIRPAIDEEFAVSKLSTNPHMHQVVDFLLPANRTLRTPAHLRITDEHPKRWHK